MSLQGRESECAALDELVDSVRKGISRCLVLRGEPGIGKTALLDYLAGSASDLRLVQSTSVESEMELPFAGLHQLCGPLLGRLPSLHEPQRRALEIVFGLSTGPAPDPLLIGLGVLTLLADTAEDRPLLCIVDDAQWLDQASALALAVVTRRLFAESVGIVFAARETGRLLEHVPELEVRGLAQRDARALLGSAVRLMLDEPVRDRVIAETHGNPLALLELPRGLTAAQLAGGFGMPGEHDLSGHIEDSFLRRIAELPDDARGLLLLAAAEPAGDPLVLRRAAHRLGIDGAAGDHSETQGLLTIGERVTFRHPLVRSAVYRSAENQQRRAVHLALADATDQEADPDRRAWHMAAAAAGPDEEIAMELERSAARAQARAGLAAAAAFLERALALTEDPGKRPARALAAAQASLEAGAFSVALDLLGTAEAGPLDALERARLNLLLARIEFVFRRGSAAPRLLLEAAKEIEPLDAGLARGAYLEALSAAMFAGRLARPGAGAQDVADAVLASPSTASPRTALDLLLDGWARMFADGSAAAAPTLQAALRGFGAGGVAANQLPVLGLVTMTAPTVWDVAQFDALSRTHVDLTRTSGALSELPLALNARIYFHLFSGELDTAAALIEESRVVIDATGASLTPWGAVALAVLRGYEREASAVLTVAGADATERGEGIGLTVLAWAQAVLYNSLRVHDKAFAAGQEAVECPTKSAAVAWALVEVIEAAARLGEADAARDAARRFSAIANAAATDWALGVHARSSALLSTGSAAEALYREALARLDRCQMRVDAARARLLYGEWLRRENRRVDARVQLGAAYEQFTSMGMAAFAERSRAELSATGETARRRTEETRDELTAQERQIARLACDGLSNAEIGVRLFLSPRTVEWHLSGVFTKLGIGSRRDLPDVLASSDPV